MYKKILFGAGIAMSFLLTACQSTADEARALALQEEFRNSSAIVEASVKVAINKLKERVEEKPTLRPMADAAAAAPEKIEPLLDFIQELKKQLISTSGMKAANQKVPKRLFTKGGLGDYLQEKVSNTRAELFGIIDDIVIQSTTYSPEGKPKMRGVKFDPKEIEKLKEDLVLEVLDSISSKELFLGATTAEAIAILDKYEVDAWNGASQVVNFLSSNVGNKCGCCYDKFDVFSSSPKPFVLLGETFESEIALGAFSSQAEFTVAVNGQGLRVEDGKAKYSARPNTIGTQSYTAMLQVIDPLSGKRDTVQKEFKYEVGMPMQSASADLMNIFYLGIENQIRIDAPSKNIAVSASAGATLKDLGNGQYSVFISKVTRKGEFVTINIKDRSTGRQLGSYPFRAKQLPLPKAKLTNNQAGGEISATEMKVQRGLMAVLENIGIYTKCNISNYTLYYTTVGQPTQKANQIGAAFDEKAAAWIQAAKPADIYQFHNIYATCPGDAKPRLLNSAAFFVK